MRALAYLVLAAIGSMQSSAALACDRYVALDRLPDGFTEIASGDLGKAELFVLTNGNCICINVPAVNRRLGKSAPDKINWSCRVATDDDRRTN